MLHAEFWARVFDKSNGLPDPEFFHAGLPRAKDAAIIGNRRAGLKFKYGSAPAFGVPLKKNPLPGMRCEAGERLPLEFTLSGEVQSKASSQLPFVAAFEYSVARFSKKFVCSTPFRISSSQGSGFDSSWKIG